MRLFRHPRWQHLDYRLKVATTQENKPPTQGTRQWTFTTPRWRCGSILLPSLNAGVPSPQGEFHRVDSSQWEHAPPNKIFESLWQCWEAYETFFFLTKHDTRLIINNISQIQQTLESIGYINQCVNYPDNLTYNTTHPISTSDNWASFTNIVYVN